MAGRSSTRRPAPPATPSPSPRPSTAGRSSCATRPDSRTGGDAVERAGIERARQRLAQADLAILVFDHSEAWSAEDQSLAGPVARGLAGPQQVRSSAGAGRPAGQDCATSALRGDGIEDLLAAIARRLVPDPPPPGAAVPFTAEQIKAVDSLLTLSKQISQ